MTSIEPREGSGGGEEVRERATALFSFLKELTELRSKAVRSVEQYEGCLWFADLPREPEVDCAAWHRGREREEPEVWVRIHRPRLLPAPYPPSELLPWLQEKEINDSSVEMPELLEEIAVRREEASEYAEPEDRFERLRLEDNPEISQLWEAYVQDTWWPWAELDRQAQSVQRVYAKLFSIHQNIQRLGEQYEVVLGLGLLSWRTPDGQQIFRHIITAQTSLSFDSSRGEIILRPAGDGAQLTFEQDMLDPHVRPDSAELQALEDGIKQIFDDVWDGVQLESALKGWVHSASSRGEFKESLDRPERVSGDPVVHLAPAILLRQRNKRSFINAFEEIIKQLKDGQPVPLGTASFITAEKSERRTESDHPRDVTPRSVAPEDHEVYFPLPANAAQKEIVGRLGSSRGVLVQGPPGTGKSHTIINLICHLLATGQRVLVTSHTARALKVLQRFLVVKVPEIAPLAVVLLGDDREGLKAMEDSVKGITGRQNHWDKSQNRKESADLEEQLARARRNEAEALSQLRALREAETYRHPPQFGGYSGTLTQIAAQLNAEQAEYGWFKDAPAEGAEPPLSEVELFEWLSLLRDEAVSAAAERPWAEIDPSRLPTYEDFEQAVGDEREARRAVQGSEEATSHPSHSVLVDAPGEALKRLALDLKGILTEVDRISRHFHEWTREAIVEILADQDRTWRELLTRTREHLGAISRELEWASEIKVDWLLEKDHSVVRADAEALVAHLEAGGRWGFGPVRPAPVQQGRYITREVRIDGRLCDTLESLKQLVAWLEVEDRLAKVKTHWAPYARIRGRTFSSQAGLLEDLCEPLEDAIELHSRVRQLREVIGTIPGLSEPTWHDLEELRGLSAAAEAVLSAERLRAATGVLSGYRDVLRKIQEGAEVDPQLAALIAAVEERDPQRFRQARHCIVENFEASEQRVRSDELQARVEGAAPRLASAVSGSPGLGSWDGALAHFDSAWRWAQASGWMRRLTGPRAEEELRLRVAGFGRQISKTLSALAAAKAWAHCFDRMTDSERQHLIAWSKAVRRIGKGTGKYAAMHRRTAREHMNECRGAIPAWVMPLYRVAETIRPEKELFDVVIIDEASQSGPEALLLTYLAKKIVVVGDDKQISPEFVGQNRADVDQLRARHLKGLPQEKEYGVDNSFFDLAEIRFKSRIRLREHFRCMPEIIQFSNNLCYSSEPLVPLRQFGANRLAPVVSVSHVPDGYQEGSAGRVINRREAEAVAGAIAECAIDEAYEGKTFGVISLLGPKQAELIRSFLIERLGPEEMEARQIDCGDAYAFQGDERDVMFLSLVSAPGEGRRIHPLTTASHERRFNVAVSRARDQLRLFHTATLNDLNPVCLRHRLLEYCTNPNVEQQEIEGISIEELRRLAAGPGRAKGNQPSPFDSWFEIDVFLRISDAGFRVIPQLEVARYRIDLVVEGMERRLAVECDGDEFHGADRYMEDMARQRDLERCGWIFWRVRGSAFTLDPERALGGLWEEQTRLRIRPEGVLEEEEDGAGENIVLDGDSDAVDSIAFEGADGGVTTAETPSNTAVSGGAIDETPITHELEAASDSETPEARTARPEPRWDPSPSDAKQTEHDRLGSEALADEPYSAWVPEDVPNPAEASAAKVMPGVVSIIATEGPMTGYRASRVYVKAAGRQKLGKLLRSGLNRALSKALRDGLIEHEDGYDPRGYKHRVFRITGSARVRIRPRGGRDFAEIPPSEIATLAKRLEDSKNFRGESLYRAILEFYEIRRMTSNIRGKLTWIDSNREKLLGG